jgi:hypothetical protein
MKTTFTYVLLAMLAIVACSPDKLVLTSYEEILFDITENVNATLKKKTEERLTEEKLAKEKKCRDAEKTLVETENWLGQFCLSLKYKTTDDFNQIRKELNYHRRVVGYLDAKSCKLDLAPSLTRFAELAGVDKELSILDKINSNIKVAMSTLDNISIPDKPEYYGAFSCGGIAYPVTDGGTVFRCNGKEWWWCVDCSCRLATCFGIIKPLVGEGAFQITGKLRLAKRARLSDSEELQEDQVEYQGELANWIIDKQNASRQKTNLKREIARYKISQSQQTVVALKSISDWTCSK